MANNLVQDGLFISVEKDAVTTGDPVVIGSFTGVALTDTRPDGTCSVSTRGVFELSVTGNDGAPAAVSLGDKLYYDDGLSLDSSGEFFGISLGSVGSGATADIPVLLK
ncbi:MAG: DUF2190 family protein [Desulfobacteraceae bacterium]|nr:DUF2190 family protein [Desulfobacteraceae bacterium]